VIIAYKYDSASSIVTVWGEVPHNVPPPLQPGDLLLVVDVGAETMAGQLM